MKNSESRVRIPVYSQSKTLVSTICALLFLLSQFRVQSDGLTCGYAVNVYNPNGTCDNFECVRTLKTPVDQSCDPYPSGGYECLSDGSGNALGEPQSGGSCQGAGGSACSSGTWVSSGPPFVTTYSKYITVEGCGYASNSSELHPGLVGTTEFVLIAVIN